MKIEAKDEGMFRDGHSQNDQRYKKLGSLQPLGGAQKLGVGAVLDQMQSTGIDRVAIFQTEDNTVLIKQPWGSPIDAVVNTNGSFRALSEYWLPRSERPSQKKS